MSDHPNRPELGNEQRYMALLALTSQELPAQPAVDQDADGKNVTNLASRHQAFYDRLDADPAALETFLRRERTGNESSAAIAGQKRPTESNLTAFIDRLSALFLPPAVRYATAFGLAAVVSVLVVLQVTNRDRLIDSVEQSYAGIHFKLNPSSALVLPWERAPTTLGFASTAANNSTGAVEFAHGLMRGKQLLSVSTGVATATVKSPYAALGEWNVLLWAVCESAEPRSGDFWAAQQRVRDRLSAVSYDDRDATVAITAHLARVNGFLVALGGNQYPARNARGLADELLLFREQFAPRDSVVP